MPDAKLIRTLDQTLLIGICVSSGQWHPGHIGVLVCATLSLIWPAQQWPPQSWYFANFAGQRRTLVQLLLICDLLVWNIKETTVTLEDFPVVQSVAS